MEFKTRNNLLHYYVDILRGRKHQETGEALHNIIRSMRMSRNSKVCGEDFSKLDWSGIPFGGIHFSLKGDFPSDFSKSTINESYFLSGHTERINDAMWTPNGKYILTCGDDGTVCVWSAKSMLMHHRMFQTGSQDLIRNNQVREIYVSADSQHCLGITRNSIKLVWNIESGDIVQLKKKVLSECERKEAISAIQKKSYLYWEYIEGIERTKSLRLSIKREISDIQSSISSITDFELMELEDMFNSIFGDLKEPYRRELGLNNYDFTHNSSKDNVQQLQSQLKEKQELMILLDRLCNTITDLLESREEIIMISSDRQYCMSINDSNDLIKIWRINEGRIVDAFGIYCCENQHHILLRSDKPSSIKEALFLKNLEIETGIVFYDRNENRAQSLTALISKMSKSERILCFSPDTQCCVTLRSFNDNYVIVRDTITGKGIGVLQGRVGVVNAVSISADKK